MKRSKHLVQVVLAQAVSIILLAATTFGYAKDVTEWAGLEQHLNQSVTVETAQAEKFTGSLIRVEPARLVVYEAATPRTIPRESVRRVIQHKSRHTAAWIAAMSAAGLGAGFLVGFNQFDDAVNSNKKVGGTALAGAGAGAAAGYGLSRMGKAEQVIYESIAGSEAEKD
jgi:hypothetical protein